ncbi:hypothetical protein ME763_03905 [Streptomyces murinus]|uniref:hypothetical protein n=1 Tax=Streptomyces murinus TaxID=33900 RepID=UPI000A1E3B49|nr:hypothetical protein [Streptomyces murinus]WDO04858.1 hypothetical protein ME763_03905 [Streptomyces murinus]
MARPAPGGYNGVVVNDLDRPIHKGPLLLASFQDHFNRGVDAMARHGPRSPRPAQRPRRNATRR